MSDATHQALFRYLSKPSGLPTQHRSEPIPDPAWLIVTGATPPPVDPSVSQAPWGMRGVGPARPAAFVVQRNPGSVYKDVPGVAYGSN